MATVREIVEKQRNERDEKVRRVMARVTCEEIRARAVLRLHDWNVHDAIVHIRHNNAKRA